MFRILLVLTALFCVWIPAQAHGGTDFYQIRTGADSGPGSLREAIINANDDPETQLAFQIPTTDPSYNRKTGVFTIEIMSSLPPITAPGTVFDGLAQTLIADSNPGGPEVQISGAKLGANMPGLVIQSPDCEVKGLTFSGFRGYALIVTGNAARGNRIMGNLFENNRDCSVVLSNGASGNWVGLAPTKEKNADEDGDFTGLAPQQMGNTFRDASPFRGSATEAIRVSGTARGNTLRGNFFHRLGAFIALRLGLGQSAPNDGIRAPHLQVKLDGGKSRIMVSFAGQKDQNIVFDLYHSTEKPSDVGNAGALEQLVQSHEIRTDAAGKATWTTEIKGQPVGAWWAMATDSNGNSSEMSAVLQLPYPR